MEWIAICGGLTELHALNGLNELDGSSGPYGLDGIDGLITNIKRVGLF